MRVRDDAGQVSVLIVGFLLVGLVLTAVVVDASAAFLRRQGLNSLADASALAATDGIEGRSVYLHGLGSRARIDPVAARRFVEGYLAGSGARARYPGLRVSLQTTVDTVVVRLSAPLDLPLHVPGAPSRAEIGGSAASVVVITN